MEHEHRNAYVAKRLSVERRIVRKLIRLALAAGYSVSTHNGGDDYEIQKSKKYSEIVATLFATDEEHVYFYKGDKRVGWVYLVYGNDGWDVCSDWTCTEQVEALMTALEPTIDAGERAMS